MGKHQMKTIETIQRIIKTGDRADLKQWLADCSHDDLIQNWVKLATCGVQDFQELTQKAMLNRGMKVDKPTLHNAVLFTCQLADEICAHLYASGTDYLSGVWAGTRAAVFVFRVMVFDPNSAEVFEEREAYDAVKRPRQ